jgi:hypothetical protein
MARVAEHGAGFELIDAEPFVEFINDGFDLLVRGGRLPNLYAAARNRRPRSGMTRDALFA